MRLHSHYGKWIGEMDWDYFITVRKHYRITKKGIRRLIETLGDHINTSSSIKRIFIVGERDIGDWNNFHTHILVHTTDDLQNTELFIREKLGEKDTIHTEPVINNTSVGLYLTKFINRDIDYDIFINKNQAK